MERSEVIFESKVVLTFNEKDKTWHIGIDTEVESDESIGVMVNNILGKATEKILTKIKQDRGYGE